jgi:GNAT superfamily N-acetyltransferase
MKILRATTDAEIAACFPAMKCLRPHLEEPSFLAKVRRQENEGYRLAYILEQEVVASAAGYRILEFMAWGRVLYVDDLITVPERRGAGCAGFLLDWLIQQGRNEGCNELHLDTGYQRHAAHRLYLHKGLQLNCHHLALKLHDGGSA